MTVILEDSIMIQGRPVTAGSKMLENFVSPLSATVADRLTRFGAIIANEAAAMHEFGIPMLFGSDAEADSAPAAVRAVAGGAADCALCNDIFGMYRKYAAEDGCCYIHPTYGTVSRFGLVPTAASMDQIGVLCKDMRQGFQLLSHIAGYDEKDGAMFTEKQTVYAPGAKSFKLGIPACAEGLGLADKFDTTSVTLPYFELYKQVLYILFAGETSNNISRYDGIKFGFRAEGHRGVNDMYLRTRTQGFGLQTKLAAIVGSVVLSQDYYTPYYEQAMRIRRLIKTSLPFDKCDVIALPTTLGDGVGAYENTALYALAVLAGLPCISFRYKGKGVQMISDVRNENALFSAWEVLA